MCTVLRNSPPHFNQSFDANVGGTSYYEDGKSWNTVAQGTEERLSPRVSLSGPSVIRTVDKLLLKDQIRIVRLLNPSYQAIKSKPFI